MCNLKKLYVVVDYGKLTGDIMNRKSKIRFKVAFNKMYPEITDEQHRRNGVNEHTIRFCDVPVNELQKAKIVLPYRSVCRKTAYNWRKKDGVQRY